MRLLAKVILSIVLVFNHFNSFASLNKESSPKCLEVGEKEVLSNGWYLWEPYQFNKITAGGYKLTGMDVELVKFIASKVGVEINYSQIDWNEHQRQMANGTIDMAAGATYTPERAEFVYFSLPYRFEENSLFVMHDSHKVLKFNSIAECLSQIRLQNFKIGITKGSIYADSQINLFVGDETNNDIVLDYEDDAAALQALMKGEIDGFLADRVVGAAVILQYKANTEVKEVQLNIKTPIHIIFSKKSIPVSLVDKFNHEIKLFRESSEYTEIVKTYLYPVLLLQTIDSEWFYLIGVIGTISFAVSGIAIAAKENTTLFGTFLFAMMPSVGGGIMRDVLINRSEVGIFLTPSYMYYILIVVLIGFFMIRLLEYYNYRTHEDVLIIKFWNIILVIGDAIGQAAFIVTGVSIAIMARIEPIELWGPFFAFLTANGGGILRDLLRKKHKILCLSGPINAEVSVVWGLIFSVFLDINSSSPNTDNIRNAVVLVALGAFSTRMIAYYFNLPNLKFRSEKKRKIID
jgi:polar amino acid transport system substrate-binding protein